MRNLAVLVLCLLAAVTAVAQQELDRIVAVVNGRVVLESEVEEAIWFERLMESKPAAAVTEQERQQAVDRAVDQEVIRQQMEASQVPPPTDREVEGRLMDLRKQLPGAHTAEGWRALLARYQLDEPTVRTRLAAQIAILRFIDVRLRPNARVDRAAMERYYQEKFVPEMRARSLNPPPFTEVQRQIEGILIEERIGDMLEEWLQLARSAADIRRVQQGSRR